MAANDTHGRFVTGAVRDPGDPAPCVKALASATSGFEEVGDAASTLGALSSIGGVSGARSFENCLNEATFELPASPIKETKAWLDEQPEGRFSFVFTPKHGSWLNLIEG